MGIKSTMGMMSTLGLGSTIAMGSIIYMGSLKKKLVVRTNRHLVKFVDQKRKGLMMKKK